ncbi:hypothetical protein MD484_g4231, partial [Candolleomyces efflorescens]
MVRTALVTGAAQGIGRAISVRLAEDGYNVVLNDLASNQIALQALADDINNTRSTSSESATSGSKVAAYVLGDVSVEDDVKNMIEVTVATFGALDIMVANAGVVVYKPISETSAEDFDRVLAVNAKGTFLCVKLAGEQMIKQGQGGRIIVESMDEATVARGQLNPGQWTEGTRQRTALKELGKPQYVADAVSFLASDKGCYITGETFGIDAGMMLA